MKIVLINMVIIIKLKIVFNKYKKHSMYYIIFINFASKYLFDVIIINY